MECCDEEGTGSGSGQRSDNCRCKIPGKVQGMGSRAEVRGWCSQEHTCRGAADCQGRNTEFGTGNLEKSHWIASSFSTNYWPVGLVVIRMEEAFFSRNYCRVGLVVIRMEERYYCVV